MNQEFGEENIKTNSRGRDRSSSSEDNRKSEVSRDISYHREYLKGEKNERERSYRSRSRSGGRYRSRSGSYRRRSRSPSRKNTERRRSTCSSPRTQPKKKPGLFIPTESDYLRHKRRKTHRSRSPVASCSKNEDREHSSRSNADRYRRSRSRSSSRRSRSPSPSSKRWYRTRSRDRYLERKTEIGPYGDPKMSPYLFQDGKYWIPVGPTFIPRGFIPTPMYPRPFMPPMMMPRMPNMMPPYRQRVPRPRQQSPVVDVTPTTSVQILEVEGDTGQSKPQDI